MRFILSAYVGPMPRPVVPIRLRPEEPLGDLVEGAVVVGDHVGVGADQQPRRVDAARVEAVELLEEHPEVDDDAVADDRDAAGRQDAARQQVQGVLLVADDDRVAGVVAAVELDDVVDPAAEQVGRLALALVAPLGADDHDRGHVRTLLSAVSHTGLRRFLRLPQRRSSGAGLAARGGGARAAAS